MRGGRVGRMCIIFAAYFAEKQFVEASLSMPGLHSLTTVSSLRGGSRELPSPSHQGQNKNKTKKMKRIANPAVTTTTKRVKSKKVKIVKHQQNHIRNDNDEESSREKKYDDIAANQILRDNLDTIESSLTKNETSVLISVKTNEKRKKLAKTKKDERVKSTKSVGGGKAGECLRRIKREWKDAVKLGIGYDWKTMQTVTVKGRSASGRFALDTTEETDKADSTFYKYNYVRIGPFGSNLLRWHFSVMGPANSCFEDGVSAQMCALLSHIVTFSSLDIHSGLSW